MARTRHGFHIIASAAVTAGTNSPVVDMLNFTKAILYVNGFNSVVEVQGSPDGSTFKDLYVFNPTSAAGALGKLQFTVGNQGNAVVIDPCPRYLRLAVSAVDLANAQIEGIKEIE